MIVSGTPKWVIQEKTKTHAHAAANVSERGLLPSTLGYAINDRENVVTTSTVQYCKGPPGQCGDEETAAGEWGWAAVAGRCGGRSCSTGSAGRILPSW